jgi:hypothetical protein
MQRVVDREQLNAILWARWTLSPGGAASRLKISRQRVQQQYQKPYKSRGFLAWMLPMKRPFFGKAGHYVYIDGGWREEEGFDPTRWCGQDPEAILAEAIRRYAKEWARRLDTG